MNCPYCKRSLTEIDYYGELPVGCIDCNRWTWRGRFMGLPEEELEALRERVRQASEKERA